MRFFHIFVLSSISAPLVATAIKRRDFPEIPLLENLLKTLTHVDFVRPWCLELPLNGIMKKDMLYTDGNYTIVDHNGERRLLRRKDDGWSCVEIGRVALEPPEDNAPREQSDEVPSCWDKGLLHGAFQFYSNGKGIRRTIHVGAGGGVVPTWIERHCPTSDVHVAEPLAPVFNALPSLGVTNTTRKHLYLSEGRQLVEAQADSSVDIIFIDAMNGQETVPPCLRTVEFFQTVYSKLVPGGVLVINSNVRTSKLSERAQIIDALRESFPASHLHSSSFTATLKSMEHCENEIMVARKANESTKESSAMVPGGTMTDLVQDIGEFNSTGFLPIVAPQERKSGLLGILGSIAISDATNKCV